MKPGTFRTRLFIQAAIVIAVLVFINLVSLKIFARADLTSNKAYSVSESTRKILKGLDDVVNIKVYFSKKLPPYMTALTRQVRDMLDEYRAYAGGSIVVDVQDPADDPETEQRVRTLGIPQVQLNVITRDKTEVMPGYLGIAILYGDKKEVLPVVQNTTNLEYDLTSAILKVTRTDEKTVGFIAGGGPASSEAYGAVMKSLEQEYQVTPVVVSDGKPVPPEVATLVVAGPEGARAWDRYAIDQFVMRGGQVLFLVNRIGIREGTLEGARVDTGLDSLLAHYGAEVKPDLVVDRSCGTASFSAGFFSFTVPYHLWPLVGPGGFDQASPITNQLERAVLPWTSSIDLRPGDAAVEAAVLAKSSSESWSESRLDLDPQRAFRPPSEDAKSPRNLAVLLKGRFTSYFKDRPVPAATAPRSTVATPETPAGEPAPVAKMDVSPETQMIVVGNSRFIEDGFLGQYPENRTFFLNSVDWLTYGGDLIGIRSRAVSARPLREIGEKSKATVRLASTLGVPLLVIAYGLVRRHARAGRRKR